MAHRDTYFQRFKIRNALIKVLAEGMAEDYKAMQDDYHPYDGDRWKPFDPDYHFKRVLESAEFAGANSGDESMELDFDETNLLTWEDLIAEINRKIFILS